MMTPVAKSEIREKLVLPGFENGMSDSKWQKIAEKLAKKFNSLTLEEIYDEWDKQFTELLKENGYL